MEFPACGDPRARYDRGRASGHQQTRRVAVANELFQEVAALTGLPTEWAEEEFAKVLEEQGVSPEELTVENLREVMAIFLETVAKQMESELAEAEITQAAGTLREANAQGLVAEPEEVAAAEAAVEAAYEAEDPAAAVGSVRRH